MRRVWTILKRIGKVLLWIVGVLAVLGIGIFIWLRVEPAEVTECDAGFTLLEHGEGAACIPDDADRVLGLGSVTNQLFTAVEHPWAVVVESMVSIGSADIPGLEEKMRNVNEGVVNLGFIDGSVSRALELLLEIDPDVILVEISPGDLLKPAETIAPVVVMTHLDTWKEMTLLSGELIDKEVEAAELLAAYDERVAILQAQFDDPSAITISNIRLHPSRHTIQLPTSFSGQIISEVGFSFPEGQLELIEETPEMLFIEISDERIDLLDGDYMLYYSGSPDEVLATIDADGDSVVDDFRNDPLYQFLGAVEAGNDYEVDMHWRVAGIYSAHAILDDLFRYVAGVDPDVVAPNPMKLSE
ncbi:MAG: ABC transporter substrate-binding protein [Chloroflexota bacterium]